MFGVIIKVRTTIYWKVTRMPCLKFSTNKFSKDGYLVTIDKNRRALRVVKILRL